MNDNNKPKKMVSAIFVPGNKDNLLEKHAPSMKHIFADDDKDLYPNLVDCEPKNPKKQGWIQRVAAKIKGVPYEQYEKERFAKKTERAEIKHQYRMKRLEDRESEEEIKARIGAKRREQQAERIKLSESRVGLQRKQTEVMKARQQAMPKMPMMGGFGGGSSGPMPKMPSLTNAFFGAPKSVPSPVVKRRVKRKKSKK